MLVGLTTTGFAMLSTCISFATQRLVAITFAIALTAMTFPGFLYNAGR